MVDAAAHLMIALGTMELIHGHHIVHLSERENENYLIILIDISLAAAIIATAAAIGGEIFTPSLDEKGKDILLLKMMYSKCSKA